MIYYRLIPGAAIALAGCLASLGCGEGPPITAPDTTAPRLTIVFPVVVQPSQPATFDRDSNGLLDIELRWSDSASSGVDPSSITIVAIGGIPGAPNPDTNLALGWTRKRLDDTSAAFEETIPLLLRTGITRLMLTLADSAGNITRESILVAVPPAAFHRTIDLDYQSAWPQIRAVSLVLLPDGSKGAVPFNSGRVAIFDPDGVFPTRYITGVNNVGGVSNIFLDSATGFAYVGGPATAGITEVNLNTEQPGRTQFVGAGAATGPFVQGNRIYVGEDCTNGRVIVLDKVSLNEVGRIETNYPFTGGLCPNTRVRSFSTDGSVGWARTAERGVFSFDAASLSSLGQLDIQPPAGDGDFGNARDVRVVGDRWLYLARLEYGLDELDLNTMQVANHYPTITPPNPAIKEFAVSPDASMLFVSADADISGSSRLRAPLLFEIPGLRLRYAFPHRPGRISDAAEWHSDGRRVYVTAEFEVDVYLVRPR